MWIYSLSSYFSCLYVDQTPLGSFLHSLMLLTPSLLLIPPVHQFEHRLHLTVCTLLSHLQCFMFLIFSSSDVPSCPDLVSPRGILCCHNDPVPSESQLKNTPILQPLPSFSSAPCDPNSHNTSSPRIHSLPLFFLIASPSSSHFL